MLPAALAVGGAQSASKAWKIVQQAGCRPKGGPARTLTFQATAASWSCTVEGRHAITLAASAAGAAASEASPAPSTLAISWAASLRVTSQVRTASLVGTREIRGLALDGSTVFAHEHPLGVALHGTGPARGSANHRKSIDVRRAVHDAFDNEWHISEKHLIDSAKHSWSDLAFIVVRLTIRAERWSCDQLVMPRESAVLVRTLAASAGEDSATRADLRLWCPPSQQPADVASVPASQMAYLFHPFAASSGKTPGWSWSLPVAHPKCPSSQTLESVRTHLATLVDYIRREAPPPPSSSSKRHLVVAFPLETAETVPCDFVSRVPLEDDEVRTWEALLDTHVVFFQQDQQGQQGAGAVRGQLTADTAALYRVGVDVTQMLLRSRSAPPTPAVRVVRLQLFVRNTTRDAWARQLPAVMQHCADLDAVLCEHAAGADGSGLPHVVEVVLLRPCSGEGASSPYHTDLAALSHYRSQQKLRHVHVRAIDDSGEQLRRAVSHSVANWFYAVCAADFPAASSSTATATAGPPGTSSSWLWSQWWTRQCATGRSGLLRCREQVAQQLRETFSSES